MASTTSQGTSRTFRQFIRNNLFILKYSFQISPVYYSIYIAISVLTEVVNNVMYVMLIKFIIDAVKEGKTYEEILRLILLCCAITATTLIVSKVLAFLDEMKSKDITGHIQRVIMTKVSQMDLIYYDDSSFYDEFIRASGHAEDNIKRCIGNVVSILSKMLSIITITAVIVTIDPVLAVFPLVAFIAGIAAEYFKNSIQYKYRLELDPIERMKNYSRRVFYQSEYAKEMRMTKIKKPLIKQFNQAIDDHRTLARKYGLKDAIVSFINEVFVWCICIFFLPPAYLSYHAIVTRRITIGDFASMNNATRTIFDNLNQFKDAFSVAHSIGLYTEHFRKFMEKDINIEKPEGLPLKLTTSPEIKLINVSFKYQNSDDYVLRNVNMTINPYEKIAIVGHNGAGKSTLIKLLLRLYDPTDGRIELNGVNIQDYTIKEYREQFGAVFQDSQLYAASIYENVMMRKMAESEKQRADKALSLVELNNKLGTLQHGGDTILTREFDDEGTLLSGGEGQKVAIARVFAKESFVVILDEPSSALDPIAEYNLNQLMLDAAKDRTVVFISHRLSTTRMADKIYLFEKGEIKEVGSHEQLIGINGEYAKMFKKQAESYSYNSEVKKINGVGGENIESRGVIVER
ncbi:multidrug ABC transporter permease [Paenibacillus silvae]|uniref:Multidrug ABC transporter permease n=1 Tax=Paenibacillus silvae TaxID=1325358 RepID=A0ABQ1ZF66_9BACL|nr:ABC transporter ATP-binding protein [Paenibacillus silvae]GGH58069.1 multidrug ABC transporter permease [Paenibacillus silvae]